MGQPLGAPLLSKPIGNALSLRHSGGLFCHDLSFTSCLAVAGALDQLPTVKGFWETLTIRRCTRGCTTPQHGINAGILA